MIRLDGKPLEQWRLKETAKQMAVVTQFNQLQFDCTVEEIVLLGRTPHPLFFTEGKGKGLCARSRCSCQGRYAREENSSLFVSVRGRETASLISRASAQEPTLLLLDEPTNHLDIKYQLDLLAIVKSLKVNVLAVLHDIQLACRYSDYLYLMKEGEILYQGTPKETITPESLQTVYGVQSQVTWTEDQQAMIHYL